MAIVTALLAGIAQVLIAGYALGVGNQTIQVALMRRFADASLFSTDKMVTGTIANYPSLFFRWLAPLVNVAGLGNVYLALHVLTSAAVLAAAYWLARGMFRDLWSAVAMVVVLLAGHHRALAGDDLYSLGFTHTWAIFPIAIFALGLAFRGRWIAALLLTGVLFNLHALTSAYLAVMIAIAALAGWRATWRRLAIGAVGFCLAAAPTAMQMATEHQTFDATWLKVTHIRSGDHSFPSTLWQAGNVELPRFALLVGIAAVALSWPMPSTTRRRSIFMLLAVAVLMYIGYACADLVSVPTVLRAQLWRASRLAMVILLAIAVHGAVWGVRLWVRHPHPRRRRIVWAPVRILEGLAGGAVLLCLAIPEAAMFLPWVLAIVTLTALIAGRLSWIQSAVSTAALLVALLAWRSIHFEIPWLGGTSTPWPALDHWLEITPAAWMALLAGVGLWAASSRRLRPMMAGMLLAEGVVAAGVFGAILYRQVSLQSQADPWTQAQRWARDHTPANSLFLTPPDAGGFRLHSDRSVVAEWRDGTQAYFNASFAQTWWDAINQLRPGMVYDDSGRRRLSAGKPLASLSDDALIALAKRFSAGYIVLPAGPELRELQPVWHNSAWAIYRPVSIVPPGVVSSRVWLEQERFMRDVVEPNIERYRKADVRLEVLDEQGQPAPGAAVEVIQTRLAFGLGCSLPFFMPVEGEGYGDYKPAPVTDIELRRFLEVGFNYSVIPYSGKWLYIEPVEGKRTFAELDKYVEWAGEHGIDLEFHFLSGLQPRWFKKKKSDERTRLFEQHARELVDRYADRIKVWQVENDGHLLDACPPVIKEIRRDHPELLLGASECTRFFSTNTGEKFESDVYRGIKHAEKLRDEGAALDYFAPHGHSPHGVWPDVRQMYDSIDRFADEGLRVRVTEANVPMTRITGPVRKGEWTPELQAEFLVRYFTVLFSHPNVDAVNYWTLAIGKPEGAGLLDEKLRPKPAFWALKKLFTETWRTRVNGTADPAGEFDFRGFLGDYTVRVTLPSGRSFTMPLSVHDPRTTATVQESSPAS